MYSSSHSFNTFVYICSMQLEEEIKQKKFKSEFQKLALNIIFTGNWLNSNSIKTFKPFVDRLMTFFKDRTWENFMNVFSPASKELAKQGVKAAIQARLEF